MKGWGFAGALIPLGVAIVVAYLRSPAVPVDVSAAYNDPETLRWFEKAYRERLKSRQVKAAWIGFGIGVALAVVLQIIMAAFP